MTIRDLEIFTKVAELGSMSAAAKTLYITQPSVSLAIAEIEKEYDVKLFDRVGNRLRLTPTGHQLLEYSSHIIHQYEEMERFLNEESQNSNIRIGATVTVGHYIISPIIQQLKRDISDVKCEVIVASTSTIEERLLRSDLDIGLVEGDINSRSLVVTPIMSDELAVICAPDHPFYSRKSIRLEDLEGESFIFREEGSGTRTKVENILRENRISYHPQWESTSFGAIKEAVMQNLGITIISPRVARQELQNGSLWACSIEDVNLTRTFDLVYRQNKLLTNSMKRFIEIVETIKHSQLGV